MRSAPLWFCTILAVSLSAASQAPQTSPPPQTQKDSPQTQSVPSSGVTLITGTQLVIVDVVVQDSSGHPIHDLKSSDFHVEEAKKPQLIKAFEERSAATPSLIKAEPKLTLPAGTFTDYLPVTPDSTLNVLLLDTLNTPMNAQSYVRDQLKQYVKHANPATRIAIFGLTTRLVLLQGFTSDPDILKAVVERRLLPRASALLDNPSGSNADANVLSDNMANAGASASVVASMQQFEAQNSSFQTQLRTRYTLEAFQQLGRYLSAFPGRKNLIWFSGSFPLAIFGSPNLIDPFAVQADFSGQLRDTTNLLDRARVAVYPIDARGLETAPMYDPARAGSNYIMSPGKMGDELNAFGQANMQEHMTMNQIADDTGGHAFYNTNGLADAVAKSIEAGANYYTLAYSPANRDSKGEYRNIRVQLNGDLAARGLRLSYRRGYYAADPKSRKGSSTLIAAAAAKAATPDSTATPDEAATADKAAPITTTSSNAYAKVAMQRGAPAPSEILFKVRILPDSTATEDTVAPHNVVNPSTRGPFRRYNVDFGAVASDLMLTPQPNGTRSGAVEFVAYVYDADGKLLNIEGRTVTMNLTPETYARLTRSGLGFHLQVSAPAKSDSFIRLAVHDVSSGHMGVVEVATSVISHLPPSPLAAPLPAKSTPSPSSSPATPTPKAPPTP